MDAFALIGLVLIAWFNYSFFVKQEYNPWWLLIGLLCHTLSLLMHLTADPIIKVYLVINLVSLFSVTYGTCRKKKQPP
jgi:hypothetical protein